MGISIKRKKKGIERLNLIPIMDAIFIFIFFLLMSAQFIDIYEIGSDAPAISTVHPDDNKKDPLNLVLEISKTRIRVLTGLDGTVKSTLQKRAGKYNFKALKAILTKIKKTDFEESSIILKPTSMVPYEDLVLIMDQVKEVPKGVKPFSFKNKKGKLVQTRKLYDQIIFETTI